MRLMLALVFAVGTSSCVVPVAFACVSEGDCVTGEACDQGVCAAFANVPPDPGVDRDATHLRIAPGTAGILRGANHRMRVRARPEDETQLVGSEYALRLSAPLLRGLEP